MSYCLRPSDDCVDVGANVGDVLAEMVRLAPEGRHVAFEPLPELAESLAARYPQVLVHNAAVGATQGTVDFHRVVDSPSRSGLRAVDGAGTNIETLQVRVARLDDALPADRVPRLIKIDVEGAEQGVIEGGMETIMRHRPIIVLEHGDAAQQFGTTPAMMYELLVNTAGLRWFDMDGGGPYTLDALQKAIGPRWNWALLP